MSLCAVADWCAVRDLSLSEQAEAYEIHVTVAPLESDELRRFREACRELQVKALVIDLGPEIPTQPMTCSRVVGTHEQAFAEGERVKKALQGLGLNVTRLKIEAAPWNPQLPEGGYYEHHARLWLPHPEQTESALQQLCRHEGAHLSRNPFKVTEDGGQQRFVTLRHPQTSREEASARAEALWATLRQANFEVHKTITEYCIYDDCRELDAAWEAADKG